MLAGFTPVTDEALEILRDASLFKWYTVTLLLLVMYVYANEIEKRNWSVVVAGLAFWLMDWLNEIGNSIFMHVTGRAPLWATTGDTSYQIFVGLTIEISMMFLIMGVVYVKMLPPDRGLRIFGIPNRWVFVVSFSCLAVFIEYLLSYTGSFHWQWWFWGRSFPVFIVLFGYATFFIVGTWVFDMDDRRKQWTVVGVLASIVLTAVVVFGPIVGWL
ncbi:MAG: hypothetical protein M5U31_06795 [Acidimicrobiia bacterium]|nr:hypothetical protein [Acidimicrobiia bacterium]